ncbi:MAG: hypothetical protein IT324_12165 [Anaerolineae bacterium]|nr:hypothetical protein [Anaerolineae bacterium]
MTDSLLLNSIFEVIQNYEKEHQNRLVEAEKTIRVLEEENHRLQLELGKGTTLLDEVTDEMLKKRLLALGTAPLDTIIREAGVVFEDRLRQIAGVSGLYGLDLVEAVLAPGKGKLVFSKHQGEQQGVHSLYRGAMQFIRNPPMHKLIEYQASQAQTLIRLIDALLQLLAEVKSDEDDNVKLEDVRHMLRRRPIPEAQSIFYQTVYKAGDKGATLADIAAQLNMSKTQVAGVLGALGVRINGTNGLENKGGLQIIVDISRLNSGEYLYRLKPILRKALELEKIV